MEVQASIQTLDHVQVPTGQAGQVCDQAFAAADAVKGEAVHQATAPYEVPPEHRDATELKSNTLLCVNLRTQLRRDAILRPDMDYHGRLRRLAPQGEDAAPSDCDGADYVFTEDVPSARACCRNVRIYEGTCFNVTLTDDGLRPNFRRPHYTSRFTFEDFCRMAAEELLAVTGSIGRNKPTTSELQGIVGESSTSQGGLES